MKTLRNIAVAIVIFVVVKSCFFLSRHAAVDSTSNSRNSSSVVSSETLQSNINTRHLSAVHVSIQRVAGFAVKYEHPFLKNMEETQKMVSAVNERYPGIFESVAIYTSKPSCGVREARLIVSTHAHGESMDIDGAADGAIAQVSALDGVNSPESSVTPITISGLPARHISYRAMRRGGVIGIESILVLAPNTRTLWHFHLIFGASKTNDYAALRAPQACAQKILTSASIEDQKSI